MFSSMFEPEHCCVCVVCLQVYLKAPMILNGVCVIWKGCIDLQRLDGMGCLEFDEERAQVLCHTITLHPLVSNHTNTKHN